MGLDLIGKGGRGSLGGGTGASAAVLAAVRAYWEGLRGSQILPRRDQIDPRGLAGALEQSFLIERVAPGHARFRLAGMQLHDLAGIDVRGMPVTALFEPAARARLTHSLEAVFAAPSVMELWLEAERGIAKPALEGRMLLLPLMSDDGVCNLALGCLATTGTIGRAPRRFAISTLLSETLTPRSPRPTDRAEALLQELAESATPYVPPTPPVAGRAPKLRLVHSRD